MAQIYIWRMAIVSASKGFTLLESLVSVLIITTLMVLSLRNYHGINLDHYLFMNNYVESKSIAIKNYERVDFESGISFNEMGHVNMARTIGLNNHSIIIHLGNGYMTYE